MRTWVCVCGGGGSGLVPVRRRGRALLLPRSGDTGRAGAPSVLSGSVPAFHNEPSSCFRFNTRHSTRHPFCPRFINQKVKAIVKRKESPGSHKAARCVGLRHLKASFMLFPPRVPTGDATPWPSAASWRPMLWSHTRAHAHMQAHTCAHTYMQTHTCARAHLRDSSC